MEPPKKGHKPGYPLKSSFGLPRSLAPRSATDRSLVVRTDNPACSLMVKHRRFRSRVFKPLGAAFKTSAHRGLLWSSREGKATLPATILREPSLVPGKAGLGHPIIHRNPLSGCPLPQGKNAGQGQTHNHPQPARLAAGTIRGGPLLRRDLRHHGGNRRKRVATVR
jgi:hypothetical protein